VTDDQALRVMQSEALHTGGIDATMARQQAQRLRALEASGMRLTGGQRHVLDACERRVRLAETFNEPKDMPR
jgi:hypothetical protein